MCNGHLPYPWGRRWMEGEGGDGGGWIDAGGGGRCSKTHRIVDGSERFVFTS